LRDCTAFKCGFALLHYPLISCSLHLATMRSDDEDDEEDYDDDDEEASAWPYLLDQLIV
jgi:hypothetical protein